MLVSFEAIASRKEKISVIGLGYVGLPIAVAFSEKLDVIGFDINSNRIEQLKNGIDLTNEVAEKSLAECTANFTSNESQLAGAKFHVVTVPTPINTDHTPDLIPLKSASKLVGENLVQGAVVVYESTVYPGVTEDICVPILEACSGLVCGVDFTVGYSPERINPGDQAHKLETTVKIVSGLDEATTDLVAKVYETIITAGVYRAESIKVAEAAKVIENAQRDINIAFVNELAMIFNKMNIDTRAVLAAAETKWNFARFSPGLVGGHCIGVDPYYLAYKAKETGYYPQVILTGRRINDSMGKYVVERLIKELIHEDIPVRRAKVAVLGFTFKENCPDIRNTRAADIVSELREYGMDPRVIDPLANKCDAKQIYDVKLSDMDELQQMDAIIVAVAHESFAHLDVRDFDQFFDQQSKKKKIILDVKGILQKEDLEKSGYSYWRL